jgi:hypothetical protein
MGLHQQKLHFFTKLAFGTTFVLIRLTQQVTLMLVGSKIGLKQHEEGEQRSARLNATHQVPSIPHTGSI